MMTLTFRTLGSLVLLLVTGWQSPAMGAERPRVAIVHQRTPGVSPALQAEARRRLRSALAQVSWELVEVSAARVTAIAPGCLVGPCLARVGKALSVQRAVLVSVSAHGSSYDISLTLLDTVSGEVVAQSSQRCDVCTYAEAAQAIEHCAGAALEQAASHEARARGTTGRAVFDQRASRRGWARWLGWSLVGLGVGSAIAGATAFGLAGNCDGGCRDGRKNLAFGLALAGGTAGAAGLGVLLWSAEPSADPARGAAMLTVCPVVSANGLGLHARLAL